ncbi:MAG: PilT/PilU family type 4a pilus ATPase [Holophagales bacterium]|nr:PilT/PilU family type 4a pilus ATPase [Holophagales bacterium]
MPGQVLDIDQLLTIMTKQGASDLHLKPARPPLLRLNGKLLPLKTDPLTIDDMQKVVDKVLQKETQHRKLEEHMAVDVGYGVPGVARFRGNLYMQRGHLAAVFRRVPFETMSLEDLDLPSVINEFCRLEQGLVLVTGPTGSGKSTTLAAIIKWVTHNRPVHIITIEDPVEFLFSDGMASISQRELGTDTMAFSEALRNAMRQDPDVIMVGEMRDPETIGTVITAAETGHLVFSTLHTNSATQTIDRILDSFSSDQQGQVRAQLAQVLAGVVSMKLVRRRDGKGRVAALEVMRNSPKIAKMIEKGETAELHEELESSVGFYRMQSMNHSLLALLVNGEITYQEAMEKSPSPDDLSLKLRRMFPHLEQKGGGEVSTSDFAEIQELVQFKKLYHEQEIKTKELLAQKDEHAKHLDRTIADREDKIRQLEGRVEEMRQEGERMRADMSRLQEEMQQKMMQARERIKELNQRLTGGAPPPPSSSKSGIFR